MEPLVEAEEDGFKKRRRRDRGNLKAKTLDEPVVPLGDPQDQPEKPVEEGPQPKKEDGSDASSSEDDEVPPEGSAVIRKTKRTPKESPFVTSTKQKVRELAAHSIASDRSAMPDKSMKSDQFAQSIERVERDPTKPKWFGPQRQSTARAISRFDYQPDLCKDYNETGYCGYGDSCKFLHDRGDYKTGWQLEKEHEEEQKRKRMKAMGEDVDDEVDYRIDPEAEDMPWACMICRNDFENPVMTQCRHYFCEKCALENYAKGHTRCATCNVQTCGIFNTAHRLLANLDKLKARREEEAKKAEEISIQKREAGSWAL
jgi:RING finger protein 113A